MGRGSGFVFGTPGCDLVEIKEWVLSLGADAKVVAPKKLFTGVGTEFQLATK